MRGASSLCADIKCPFFRSETEKSIACEGVEIDIYNTMRFKGKEEKVDYIKRFCFRYPNDCHICQAAKRKYE